MKNLDIQGGSVIPVVLTPEVLLSGTRKRKQRPQIKVSPEQMKEFQEFINAGKRLTQPLSGEVEVQQ